MNSRFFPCRYTRMTPELFESLVRMCAERLRSTSNEPVPAMVLALAKKFPGLLTSVELFVSACVRTDDVIPLLRAQIAAGVDINAVSHNGHSAITRAVASGSLAVIEFLVGQNADLNRTDMTGGILLHAMFQGDIAIVKYVISVCGPEMFAKRWKNGDTNLHWYVRTGSAIVGDASIVREYMSSPWYDATARNDRGETVADAIRIVMVDAHFNTEKLQEILRLLEPPQTN